MERIDVQSRLFHERTHLYGKRQSQRRIDDVLPRYEDVSRTIVDSTVVGHERESSFSQQRRIGSNRRTSELFTSKCNFSYARSFLFILSLSLGNDRTIEISERSTRLFQRGNSRRFAAEQIDRFIEIPIVASSSTVPTAIDVRLSHVESTAVPFQISIRIER